MAPSVIHLTQSRYYSPAFNAAVFDGPIRVYFAQHQEPLALQVYFKLQQRVKESYAEFRRSYRYHGQTIFVMLYPTEESFLNSFDGRKDIVQTARLGEDHVVGVRGPLAEESFPALLDQVDLILKDLQKDSEHAAPLT